MTALTTTEGRSDLPRYFAPVYASARAMKAGRITFVLPDGRRFRADGAQPGPIAELHVHDPDLFARLIREGQLGFAEAYLVDAGSAGVHGTRSRRRRRNLRWFSGHGWIPTRSATVQANLISTSLPSSDRNASTGDR